MIPPHSIKSNPTNSKGIHTHNTLISTIFLVCGGISLTAIAVLVAIVLTASV